MDDSEFMTRYLEAKSVITGGTLTGITAGLALTDSLAADLEGYNLVANQVNMVNSLVHMAAIELKKLLG